MLYRLTEAEQFSMALPQAGISISKQQEDEDVSFLLLCGLLQDGVNGAGQVIILAPHGRDPDGEVTQRPVIGGSNG